MASHPHTASFAAHTHRHFHRFIGEEDGWPASEPHHLVSMGTTCGAWWTGAHDEYGIPHSMMRDGTPTGYGFLEIDGTDWKLTYKAARRPGDFQMHVFAPDEISTSSGEPVEVFVNVFNALPGAQVEMRIGNDGSWRELERTEEPDPVYEEMRKREEALEEVPWREVGGANPNPRHLWKGTLPGDLGPGTYTIFVRSEDDWDLYEGRRIIRITE